jgi:hypothetical protein
MIDQINIDPASIPPSEIPAILAQLGALQVQLVAPLLMATPTVSEPAAGGAEAEDQMLAVAEAAQRLRRSPKWVYRRIKSLPFARRLDNRSWVFSSSKPTPRMDGETVWQFDQA